MRERIHLFRWTQRLDPDVECRFEITEVAAAVVFLASDAAANIHGTVLGVDGGWAAI